MADLDAELLALAGGDDSSDEESPAISQQRDKDKDRERQASGSPASKDQDNDGEMGRKGIARPVKRQRKRARAYDDEEEEGELSSSSVQSRRSLRSASMSESESDTSPPPEENQGPIFPYEKLFYSAKDKSEIMALPEIQREELLSERAHQVDRHNQDIALRRLLANREREEARAAAKKKRKASSTDLEDSQRKSSRKKTVLGGRKVGEPSDAIEAYKRQREQKGKRDEQRRRDASSRKNNNNNNTGSSPARETDDRDASGESEVEWDEGTRRSPPQYDPPAELADFQRARVGRSNFAQVCFYPGFDRAINNCYARVSLGPNPSTGKPEYRIGLIKRFTEGRPYAIEGPNGRNFITTQYCRLAHGKAEKDFPFIACSDSPFTEGEFNRYRQTMIVEDCKMPTKSMVSNKVADINRLLNHQFTKEELEEKLRRQGTNDNKQLIFSRIQLERRRNEAIANKDEAAIAECDAELARLTGPKLAFGTSLTKPRSSEKSQQERLAELNLRNQKLNTENVRKAQLAERKAAKMAAVAVARGEAVADRFARVKTRARTYYESTDGHLVPVRPEAVVADRSRALTPTSINVDDAASTPTNGTTPRSTTPSKPSTPKVYKGVPVIRHRPTDEDNIAALDLGIDIEI
ncbi:RNA polymerase-associated protein rtf1 [Microsporum ferrugineum]